MTTQFKAFQGYMDPSGTLLFIGIDAPDQPIDLLREWAAGRPVVIYSVDGLQMDEEDDMGAPRSEGDLCALVVEGKAPTKDAAVQLWEAQFSQGEA